MISRFQQVKFGAILSYLLMIINMVYGLWITPFLILKLGTDEYGLYKLVGSLSSALIVLNFGIGDTVKRYTALYLAKHEEDKIPNLMAMCLIITVILSGLIAIIGSILITIFPKFYSDVLNSHQLSKAKLLLSILIFSMILTVFENLISGLLIGYSNFIFSNSLKIVIVLIRSLIVWLAINLGGDSVALVTISCILISFVLLIEYAYVKSILHIRIKYIYWDVALFKEAGCYTMLMFLITLSNQAFSNVDNIVIGAFLGTTIVSLYSVGQYFFNLFQQLSYGVASVMLPTITFALNSYDGKKKAEKLVIKAGRVQFMLLGAALAGIVCMGKEFIYLWLGNGFDSVYILILILVVPSMFELCINVCGGILQAENKIAFRTCVVFISAVINMILTVVLVRFWSYMGAAVATAFSYIICSLISMNIYYSKVIKLDILSIYRGILSKLWLCVLVPSLITLVIKNYIFGSWRAFIVKVFIFSCIYIAMLMLYGLNNEEKKQIPILGRLM